MRLHRSKTFLGGLGVAAVGTALMFAGGGFADQTPQTMAVRQESAPRAERPRALPPLSGLDLASLRRSGDMFIAPVATPGATAELTLDPALQSTMKSFFVRNNVPYGATVAIDVRTGKVLAYVNHSSANPEAGQLTLDATPPAASIFKIVTSAALIENGVAASTRVCHHGGFHRLTVADIVDDANRDTQCSTMSEALGGSINPVFAKLATRHLDPQRLDRYAAAFGFGHPLPFDVPTQASPGEIPTDSLEFARTAAGFWHMHMSPLHGAVIAATIARGGVMPRARIVERVVGASGEALYQASEQVSDVRRVVSAATATTLGKMMERTVTEGTSRRAFHDRAGNSFVPVSVAGKTGTLDGTNPYRAYTWWVGFAPVENPQIAIATLVVNTPLWRVKANQAAVEVLRTYFRENR